MTTNPGATLVRLSDTDLMLASADDDVLGLDVVDRNGDEIGEVDDLVIDPNDRQVRFLQVGAGGFLGIGQQERLIPIDAIERVDDEAVHVAKDRAHVAGGPGYDPRLVQQPDFYEGVYDYYGYEPFWRPGYIYPTIRRR